MDAQVSFLSQLIAEGLLAPTGVDGLYGRSAAFERVIQGLEAMIASVGADDGAELLRFPPAVTRTQFEASGYMKNFPQLAGTVHAFCGGDHEHVDLLAKLDSGKDWTAEQKATELVLTPAACYPLYPMAAAQGPIAAEGRLFDVQSYCFRHEPSRDPARMQLFRMREYVRIGEPEQVEAFREMWIERAGRMAQQLELPFEVVPANDPFFGRLGKVMRSSQREQGLKLEGVIPIANVNPTACLSFNYHMDHFAEVWRLRLATGAAAHTGCVGFGLERLALALFRHHGFDSREWPAGVRRTLWS